MRKLIVFMAALLLAGCSGLNYSQTFIQDYKSRTIAVLPIDTGANAESVGVIDKVIAEALSSRGFEKVVTAASLKSQVEANPELKSTCDGYISKLKAVSYSDPDLSSRMGRICGVESFLLCTVDQWSYVVENEDKLARVGLSLRLIDARTGKDVWTSAHSLSEKYVLLKPELADVARKLAGKMLSDMPR